MTVRAQQGIDQWMTNLGTIADDLPITQFPLPGSHDAVAYGTINEKSKTQEKSILQQLRAGFRFFDLRVRVDNSVFFGHHGADEVRDNRYCPHWLGVGPTTVFQDIKAFSQAHPHEVIILLFNDATSVWGQSFNAQDKIDFINHVASTFPLAAPPTNGRAPTYGELKKNNTPVIALIEDGASWNLEGAFDAAFCASRNIWLASSWLKGRFSNYRRLAGRSYQRLYELTAEDQEEHMVNERDLEKFWVSQTILGYDNASTSGGHSANYWGAQAMNDLWVPTLRNWFLGRRWNGETGTPVPKPNVLLVDYSGVYGAFPEECSDLLTRGAVVPVYRHQAPAPDRYFYDIQLAKRNGWTPGVPAFNAYSYQYKGTVPVYRHEASGPDRYYYDTQPSNRSGWTDGVIAFYAYPSAVAGSIPIYRHEAPNPDRYYYDTERSNHWGWTDGVEAFHVPA